VLRECLDPGNYVSFFDIGSAGHVDGNSSAGGGSIFFRRRTAGLFRIIRRLRAITVLNHDRTRVFAVRRMMLHPSTSNPDTLSLLVLLKTVQCFFAKQVRASLTCFGKFDDLVRDDFVSNHVVINLDSSISKRGANQLIRYPHNANGLGIE
jgi:hypothetical protein